MDKKQKKKAVSTVCFVLVCGAVSLGIHHGTQKKGQIVLEKNVETSESEVAGVTEAPALTEGEECDASAEKMYVHLCGAVGEEGVYTLPKGSRLIDGVTAAGGFTTDADTTYHNLAALLTDGQKVYVPTLAETEELSVAERMESTGDGSESEQTSNREEVRGKVNINTAGKEDLMTLSGIGESKAESILLYREKVGPFQSIEELKNVTGIGDAMFARIKDSIVTE